MLKTAEQFGGLSNFFTTPFAIVVGTRSPDPEMRRVVRAKAEQLAAAWRTWQHVTPRVLDDTAVTRSIEREYSLLLVGGTNANAVTRRIAARLPLRIERNAVSIDGRRFAASDAAVEMIRPSPWAKDRYVMVAAGTSPGGMYLWNPLGFWNYPLGFHTNPYDWTIRDGRTPILAPGLMAERGWVASGLFDRKWRRSDALTFLGDPAVRASAKLRRMVAPDYAPPVATLDSYVGRYRLSPDVEISVRRDGKLLVVDPPSGLSVPLRAEDERTFFIDGQDGYIEFQLAADGSTSGARMVNGSGIQNWQRVADR